MINTSMDTVNVTQHDTVENAVQLRSSASNEDADCMLILVWYG